MNKIIKIIFRFKVTIVRAIRILKKKLNKTISLVKTIKTNTSEDKKDIHHLFSTYSNCKDIAIERKMLERDRERR